MYTDTKREDLRIQKTRRALYAALADALTRERFSRISVNEICTTSLVSKTAFYAHYKDKFDLLAHWLEDKRNEIFALLEGKTEWEKQQILHSLLQENMSLIANLIDGATQEQSRLVCQTLLSRRNDGYADELDPLEDFISGGLYNIIARRILPRKQNKAAVNKELVDYVYQITSTLLNWGQRTVSA